MTPQAFLQALDAGELGRGGRGAFLRALEDSRPDAPARVAREIAARVARDGDRALLDLTREHDAVDLSLAGLEVPPDAVAVGAALFDAAAAEAFRRARANIEAFHQRQLPQSYVVSREDGSAAGQLVRPLDRVGIYVPGPSAPLVSSLLMAAVMARLAGVREIIAFTPPGPGGAVSPAICHAVRELGIARLFRANGPAAVAAMAFGTETIPRCDLVAGPGNAYVTAMKQLVAGWVGVDTVAGPSELAVVADETARADWVAADLVAQAEHGPDTALAVFVTEAPLLDRILAAVDRRLAGVRRAAPARESLAAGVAVVADDLRQAMELADRWAPEHLAIHAGVSFEALEGLRAAGAVFLGAYSAVAAGDYAAGPGHILPTGGAARWASPAGVYSFVRRTNFLHLAPPAAAELAPVARRLACVEGLEAHAASLALREGRRGAPDDGLHGESPSEAGGPPREGGPT